LSNIFRNTVIDVPHELAVPVISYCAVQLRKQSQIGLDARLEAAKPLV
jgi:hypothetical protein